jgi:hypothetical protein
MSQHCYTLNHLGRPTTVTLGWDRPLQYLFMTVHVQETTSVDDTDEDEGYLYSNLNTPTPFSLELEDFQAALDALGINVSAEMFVQVTQDQQNNIGNRCVAYTGDGRMSETGTSQSVESIPFPIPF